LSDVLSNNLHKIEKLYLKKLYLYY